MRTPSARLAGPRGGTAREIASKRQAHVVELTRVTARPTATSPRCDDIITAATSPEGRATATASATVGAVGVPAAAAATSAKPSAATYATCSATSTAAHEDLKSFAGGDRELSVHERTGTATIRIRFRGLRPAPAPSSPQHDVEARHRRGDNVRLSRARVGIRGERGGPECGRARVG